MGKLDKFFFSKAPAGTMNLCRIFFGVSLFFYYLSVLPHFAFDFGVHGIFGFDFYKIFPDATPFRSHLHNLQLLHFISSPFVLRFLLAILVACSGLFALGIKIRVTGIIAVILHSLFHAQNEFMYWGWGELIKPFMIYIILFDFTKGAAWPMRLLQFHICSMYFITAFARIDDGAWLNGSVIYEILQQSMFHRFDMVARWMIPFTKLTTYLSWTLELAAPFLLMSRKYGRYMALSLIVMHLGLELFTLVGWWNFVMIGALTVFLPSEWISKKRFALIQGRLQSLWV